MSFHRSSSDLNVEAKERIRHRTYVVDAVLLLLFTVLLCVELFVLIRRGGEPAVLYSSEASIRATSEANYGSGWNGFLIPPFDEKLIEQLIADLPATNSPHDRISTLQASLLTPVATMTNNSPVGTVTNPASPMPSASASSTLVWSPTPRITPTPTVASGATTVPTSAATGTTPPLVPTLPPILPTNPPLPTVPLIVPTLPPIVPTSLPLPTLPSLPALP